MVAVRFWHHRTATVQFWATPDSHRAFLAPPHSGRAVFANPLGPHAKLGTCEPNRHLHGGRAVQGAIFANAGGKEPFSLKRARKAPIWPKTPPPAVVVHIHPGSEHLPHVGCIVHHRYHFLRRYTTLQRWPSPSSPVHLRLGYVHLPHVRCTVHHRQICNPPRICTSTSHSVHSAPPSSSSSSVHRPSMSGIFFLAGAPPPRRVTVLSVQGAPVAVARFK